MAQCIDQTSIRIGGSLVTSCSPSSLELAFKRVSKFETLKLSQTLKLNNK